MIKFFSTVAMVLSPLGALAADLPARGPAPAPAPAFVAAPSWAGFYVGAFGGWAGLRTTATDIIGEEFGGGTPGAKMSLRSSVFFGGVTAGYNFQNGAWVYGPEMEIGYLHSDKTRVINGSDGLLSNFRGLYGFGGARVGYAVTSNALLFAKAGVVWTRIGSAGGEFDGVGNEDDGGFWGFDGNEAAGGTRNRIGFAVGGGVEVSVARNWSIKGEYLYKDFGSKTYQTLVTGIQPFKFRDSAQTVKLGVNYRFGGSSAGPVVARY